MYLRYFTEKAYDQLYENVESNKDKYLGTDDWLADYFENNDNYFCVSKAVDVKKFELESNPNNTDSEKSKEDLINVRILYDALKNLTPLQAANKYMWAYLCHQNQRYIRERWLQNIRENTIRERFFVKSDTSLWNDNALSRLWWYGYFTYDGGNRSNPYELTEILLTNQTLATDVIDTLNRMNPNRIKGVLYGLRDYIEKIGKVSGVADDFRECKKYLNHYAAVADFDFLDYEDIEKITCESLTTIYKNKAMKY